MGKKLILSKQSVQKPLKPQKKNRINSTSSNFAISDKSYASFFKFLKGLHSSKGKEGLDSAQASSFLSNITTTLINFFNYEKRYNLRNLECSLICLANVFSVIGNNIKLRFGTQFACKLRRFLSQLLKNQKQDGFQPKLEAILYILALLIYKERVGGEKAIRQLNSYIYQDRVIVNALLKLELTVQKKIGKFYGIIIIYLSRKNLNSTVKKKLVKSILLNMCNIDHQSTLFNLLAYLRSEKNKISINFKDIQQGNIFEMLLRAYPKHTHEYQSFCIIDYLNHLISLFPILAQKVENCCFLANLLQKTEPTHLHHPLHSLIIIQFIEKSLKYLQSDLQIRLLNQILAIKLKNKEVLLKLSQMFINLYQSTTILRITLTGYFNQLITIIQKESEDNLKLRAAELYTTIIQRVSHCNQSISGYLAYKIRAVGSHLRAEQKLKIVDLLNQKVENAY